MVSPFMALSKVTLVKVPHNELKNTCPAILVLMPGQRKTRHTSSLVKNAYKCMDPELLAT
jgi:hypothetical protein